MGGSIDHATYSIETIENEGNEDEIKIIKKNGENFEKITIEKSDTQNGEGGNKMIFISEDGEVHEMDGDEIKIIKKKKDGNDEEIEIKSGGDHEMIWIEKEGSDNGDVIIIEEETTEEIDENGKTIKKTIKKKKKVVKGDRKKY